jgi:hypothetical protein
MAFGGFSFQQDGKIWTSSTDVYSSAENSVQVEDLSQSDGGVYVRSALKSKTFSVNGFIQGDSIIETDKLIDQFKLMTRLPQQEFDIVYAGSTRRYIATMQNLAIARANGLTTAGWSVQFICASPIGWDIATTTLLTNYPITLSSMVVPLFIGGSYKAEPALQLTYSAVTGGAAKTVRVANDATLRGLSITRDWVAGDVLTIDSLKKNVYVNSRPQDFTGQFPTWDIGAAGLSYVDDMTSRTALISGDYTRRWL